MGILTGPQRMNLVDLTHQVFQSAKASTEQGPFQLDHPNRASYSEIESEVKAQESKLT